VRALYGQASALPASLFDLGISPYINASIFVVMILAIPDPLLAPIKGLMRLKEARKQGRSVSLGRGLYGGAYACIAGWADRGLSCLAWKGSHRFVHASSSIVWHQCLHLLVALDTDGSLLAYPCLENRERKQLHLG